MFDWKEIAWACVFASTGLAFGFFVVILTLARIQNSVLLVTPDIRVAILSMPLMAVVLLLAAAACLVANGRKDK